MTLQQFSNGLRVLLNLDHSDMVGVVAIDRDDKDSWIAFMHDPWRWFIKADDEKQAAVWKLIKGRMR